MEPHIQYAETADGVSIAFWTLGEGPPFVCMPNVPWSHLELEWQDPRLRRWLERLAEKRLVVRYDNRGSGLSDREIADFSLDAHLRDMEAVVDRLGLETFALMGPLHSGPAAIAYAARHPERVSHLILWCTYARGSDYSSVPQVQAIRALMDKDWDVYTETVAHVGFGWSAGEDARQFAGFIRGSVSQQAVQAFRDAIDEYDVTDLLARVTSPTLVLHRRRFELPSVDVARRLTARIPEARLVLLDGASAAPFLEDAEAVLKAISDFLGMALEPARAAVDRGQAPVTILFTDIEGSTALTQRRGDARAQEVLRAHNEIARGALAAHGGSEIKHTGDGIMASFASASRAISSALAMQKGFAAHNESHSEAPIHVRIGLNAGEPVAEEGDLFGTAVQLAARIAAHADPGWVLVSNVVRELAAGKGFLFADIGEVALRGFEDPVRLYQVRWREYE
jgi:class 3 adenylate cyclase